MRILVNIDVVVAHDKGIAPHLPIYGQDQEGQYSYHETFGND
jgi:hypothetical protein